METKKTKVVIISSYEWDDPMTDMNCAWGTYFNVLYPETGKIGSLFEGTGWGQRLKDLYPDYEFIDIKDDHRKMYADIKEKAKIAKADKDYERFLDELAEYNAKRLPQEIGQIVKVVGKGKHNGKVGKVSWFGKSKFNRSYGSRYTHWKAAAICAMMESRPYTIPNKNNDLILVRPTDGSEKFYIDPKNCEVIEGYKEVTLDREAVYRYEGIMEHNSQCLKNGYDYRTY